MNMKFGITGAVAGLMLASAPMGADAATLSIVGGTSGSIPGGQANDVITAPGGPGSPLGGFFGSQIEYTGSQALRFEFIGFEAGFENQFNYAGTERFDTEDFGGNNNSDWSDGGLDEFVAAAVFSSGNELDFSFDVNSDSDSVVNGSNPDNTPNNVNFFASIESDPTATSGRSLLLFLDDAGAGDDDNHDDMVVRISVVPLPAGGLLLLTALGGMAVVRRRRKAA